MNQFAKNLKYLRQKNRYKQRELSQKIGLNRSIICAYELGRAEPKLDSLIIIADFFRVSIDELLRNDMMKGIKSKGLVAELQQEYVDEFRQKASKAVDEYTMNLLACFDEIKQNLGNHF